ncbi:hypothetical protein Hsar01_01920 [Haloferula sargassicola]|uniref:Uncharacterized protein n=1 Tax=Haloferula sargassicola TaxID=490096 RepID=A0ABP9UMR0_9BACT
MQPHGGGGHRPPGRALAARPLGNLLRVHAAAWGRRASTAGQGSCSAPAGKLAPRPPKPSLPNTPTGSHHASVWPPCPAVNARRPFPKPSLPHTPSGSHHPSVWPPCPAVDARRPLPEAIASQHTKRLPPRLRLATLPGGQCPPPPFPKPSLPNTPSGSHHASVWPPCPAVDARRPPSPFELRRNFIESPAAPIGASMPP